MTIHSASENLSEGIQSLAERIDRKREEKKDVAFVEAFAEIAGRTCSGKTEIIAKAHQAIFGKIHSTLPMDGYFKGRKFLDKMKEEGKDVNRDHTSYMNFDYLNDQLSDLMQGKTVKRPVFDYDIGERIRVEDFPPNKIIILEGTFALRPEVRDVGGIKVFVDTSLYSSLMRRVPRDAEKRHDRDPAQALLNYLTVVEPMYQKYVAPTRQYADLTITNEYDPFEVEKYAPFEVQVKFRFDKANMRRILSEKVGVSLLKAEVYQHDLYFKLEAGDPADILVRIRSEEGKYYFTCRGPKIDKMMGMRPNMEFGLDSKTYAAIFDKYKGRGTAIAKVREVYSYDGTIINLDTVKKAYGEYEETSLLLGDFIELKGLPDEVRIKSICDELRIPYEGRITDSYVDLKG